MATIRIVRSVVRRLRPTLSFSISGTVLDQEGTALSRRVIAYRGGSETEVHAATQSDGVTGAWVLTVYGNHNDDFRVEAMGLAGENSNKFDHVSKPA